MFKIFQQFDNLKVLIIGDAMIDSYLWGEVARISPEAPVPIVKVQKREQRPGGAANVALNIRSLGANPLLFTVIGDDLEGDNFLSLLKKHHLSTDNIVRGIKRVTTIKHRIIAGSQHILRVDSEDDSAISEEEKKILLQKIELQIAEADVIIMQDYDKGLFDKKLISNIINMADKNSVPTVVDPKKRNFFHYQGASLFKPNLKELKESLHIDIDPADSVSLKNAVKSLREKTSICSALITLSDKGIFIDHEGVAVLIHALKREISDVSGAGDTVLSIAALCIALKLPAKLIANLANIAGGLVCEHIGVVPVNKKDLLDEVMKLGA